MTTEGQTVEQHAGEAPTVHADSRHVESALKALWEKARRAGELIAQLREENAALRTQVETLREELRRVQEELSAKARALAEAKAAAGVDAQRAALFANGEREALATRVKDLLAKIEAYL